MHKHHNISVFSAILLFCIFASFYKFFPRDFITSIGGMTLSPLLFCPFSQFLHTFSSGSVVFLSTWRTVPTFLPLLLFGKRESFILVHMPLLSSPALPSLCWGSGLCSCTVMCPWKVFCTCWWVLVWPLHPEQPSHVYKIHSHPLRFCLPCILSSSPQEILFHVTWAFSLLSSAPLYFPFLHLLRLDFWWCL